MQRIIIAIVLLSIVINSSRATFMNILSVKGNTIRVAEHFFLQPHSYMTVTGEATSRIENRIQNGSFEDGLSHWNISGDVELTSSDEFLSPEDGKKMIRIGKSTNPGRPLRLNVLSQQLHPVFKH